MIQKFHAGLGCTGSKAFSRPGIDRSQRARCHAVNILIRKQCITGRKLIQMRRQRAKHQTAVNGAVPIDALNGRKQFGLSAGCRQRHADGSDPDLFTAFQSGMLIAQIIDPFSYPQDCETGNNPATLQTPGANDQILGDFSRNRRAS